jgi:hypothetical protein
MYRQRRLADLVEEERLCARFEQAGAVKGGIREAPRAWPKSSVSQIVSGGAVDRLERSLRSWQRGMEPSGHARLADAVSAS